MWHVFDRDYSEGRRRMNDIKSLRSLTGLSQTDFGKLYGIPLRTIQNWEGGQRTPPEYVLILLEKAIRADFPETKQ